MKLFVFIIAILYPILFHSQSYTITSLKGSEGGLTSLCVDKENILLRQSGELSRQSKLIELNNNLELVKSINYNFLAPADNSLSVLDKIYSFDMDRANDGSNKFEIRVLNFNNLNIYKTPLEIERNIIDILSPESLNLKKQHYVFQLVEDRNTGFPHTLILNFNNSPTENPRILLQNPLYVDVPPNNRYCIKIVKNLIQNNQYFNYNKLFTLPDDISNGIEYKEISQEFRILDILKENDVYVAAYTNINNEESMKILEFDNNGRILNNYEVQYPNSILQGDIYYCELNMIDRNKYLTVFAENMNYVISLDYFDDNTKSFLFPNFMVEDIHWTQDEILFFGEDQLYGLGSLVGKIRFDNSLSDTMTEGCMRLVGISEISSISDNTVAIDELQVEILRTVTLMGVQDDIHINKLNYNFNTDNLAAFQIDSIYCINTQLAVDSVSTFLYGGHAWTLYHENSVIQSSTDIIPELYLSEPGQHMLIHELQYGACEFIDTQYLYVIDATIDVQPDNYSLCQDSITATAIIDYTGSDYEITWYDSEFNSISQDTSLTLYEPGVYIAQLDVHSCTARDTIVISQRGEDEYLRVYDSGEEEYCLGDTIEVEVDFNASTGLVSEIMPSTRRFVIPFSQEFTMETTCGTYVTSIEIGEGLNCETIQVYIPNAFSPNGDGINDIFRIYSPDTFNVEMTIYNRWGAIVYQCEGNNETCLWNGEVKNLNAQEGVYVYKINVSNDFDQKTYTGDVTVLR